MKGECTLSFSTQKQLLLNHLQKNRSITSMQATRNYNILRPSNRIQELKADGWDIQTEIIYKKRRNGTTTHYAKYTLVS